MIGTARITTWSYTGAFEELRGNWYKLSARTDDPELVVHRRQLLLIMKLAIVHCEEHSGDLLKARAGYFGTILLMANDQFHYELFPAGARGMVDGRDKVSRVLAEFVPVNEYAEREAATQQTTDRKVKPPLSRISVSVLLRSCY